MVVAKVKLRSEEMEKFLAFAILLLAYLLVPLLVFLFALAVIYDISYFMNFLQTGDTVDMRLAILLSAVNICFFFGLRALIKWLRE